MLRRYVRSLLLLVLFAAGGCKDVYFPEYEPSDLGPVLIVEGFIDMQSESSLYTLGLARPIAEDSWGLGGNTPVVNATVVIEAESGATYTSQVRDIPGLYVVPHPILDTETRYRLRIQMGEDTYLSDFVEPKISPEITSVDWEATPEGLQLFVSTEDPNNQSHFYRWEFEETWRFSAGYISEVILENGEFRDRTEEEQISICFSSDHSHDLHIGSSVGLGVDAIHRQPIQFIPRSSEKLQYRYSLLVKQRVISEEAFVYWRIIKQNSEDLGDIFSPLPSEIRGNIQHTTDAQKKVVGMVEAVGVTEHRVFVDPQQLPGLWITHIEDYDRCNLLENSTAAARDFLLSNPNYIPVYGIANNPASPYPTDYTFAPRYCVDCTLRGTLEVPDFWE